MTAETGTTPTGTRYSARTHVGSVRRLNEDAIVALPEVGLWAVSDGMGGHAAGDFASQTVTEAIATVPPGLAPLELIQAARAAIVAAHEQIRAESHRRGGVTIGATVVSLILAEGHFACLWVGDSRLYRLRAGEIAMLSHDHSLVAELVERGELTWDEAERHPQANAITRAVGVGETVEIDKRRGDARPGDRFLVCSDGFSRYAGLARTRALLEATPIEIVADRLVQAALDGGGADNVSVIVVDVV